MAVSPTAGPAVLKSMTCHCSRAQPFSTAACATALISIVPTPPPRATGET